MSDRITRILIEASLGKWLEDLKADTRRSVRRLVEMGCFFSKGKNQKQFFDDAMELLSDPDSAYYELLSRLTSTVGHDALKHFGMNLGYNGLSRGAKERREAGIETGGAISWAQVWRDGGSGPPDLEKLVADGRSRGIYIYFVICNSEESSENACAVAGRFVDCDFFIFCRALPVPDTRLTNIMTLIPVDSESFSGGAKALAADGRLWGGFCEYTDPEPVLGDGMLQKMNQNGCLFCFFFAGESADGGSRDIVYDRIYKTRTEQRTALFPVELDLDIDAVNSKLA